MRGVRRLARTGGDWRRYEAAVPAGLEDVAADELSERLGNSVTRADVFGASRRGEAGRVTFTYRGDPCRLTGLHTVLAVYLVAISDVVRPRAFLGEEHLQHVTAVIDEVVRLWPPHSFATLRIGAAGHDTPILRRLAAELARRTGLREPGSEDRLNQPGRETYVRLRPGNASHTWEALVRLSPLPASARTWRVCDMPGALNAAVAHAMVRLSQPQPTDVVLNLACGSGTLAIERLTHGSARRVIACDTSATALRCAAANLRAAGVTHAVDLRQWDARCTSLPAASVDVVLVDLPFGHRIGSAQENETLYPAILSEAARVTRADGRLVLISHSARQSEAAIHSTSGWQELEVRRVSLARVQTWIYVLRRQWT